MLPNRATVPPSRAAPRFRFPRAAPCAVAAQFQSPRLLNSERVLTQGPLLAENTARLSNRAAWVLGGTCVARAKRNNDTTANLGSETKLWAAADALGDNRDAAEYKHAVLGLIFPRYMMNWEGAQR